MARGAGSQRRSSSWLPPQSGPSDPSGEEPRASRGGQGPPNARPRTRTQLRSCCPARRQQKPGAHRLLLTGRCRRTLEGESAEASGTAALRALGTGLSLQLGQPRTDLPRYPAAGSLPVRRARRTSAGRGSLRTHPRAGGSGLVPPFPACITMTTTADRLRLPRGPSLTLPRHRRSASGPSARTRSRGGV